MVSTCLTRNVQQGTCRGPSTQFKTFQPPLRSVKNIITKHLRNVDRAITAAASGQEIDAASSSPTTPTKIAAENPKVSRRAFQGEALLLALLCTTMKSGEAQAIGFKKELKKKKIPIEQYSELGKKLEKQISPLHCFLSIISAILPSVQPTKLTTLSPLY